MLIEKKIEEFNDSKLFELNYSEGEIHHVFVGEFVNVLVDE